MLEGYLFFGCSGWIDLYLYSMPVYSSGRSGPIFSSHL